MYAIYRMLKKIGVKLVQCILMRSNEVKKVISSTNKSLYSCRRKNFQIFIITIITIDKNL